MHHSLFSVITPGLFGTVGQIKNWFLDLGAFKSHYSKLLVYLYFMYSHLVLLFSFSKDSASDLFLALYSTWRIIGRRHLMNYQFLVITELGNEKLLFRYHFNHWNNYQGCQIPFYLNFRVITTSLQPFVNQSRS